MREKELQGVWKMKRLFVLPVLLLTLLVSGNPASSAYFQKGLGAYNKGDFATALREWTPLAEQGNAGAQFNLGWMYKYGKGVPQDDKTAVKWYKLAAEQGNADAQNHLGLMYNNGQGVPQDYKTAVKWYSLSAEQGDAPAQYNLGLMYATGQGVPQDYKTAVKWYKLAAEQGNAIAQGNLGWMYYNGQGVPQDHKTAVKWFTLAAEQGDAIAQFNLGLLYKNGQGVPQDYKTAVKWYKLAAKQGHKNAREQRKIAEILVDLQEREKHNIRTQKSLEVIGLYSGKQDGISGKKTKSAIRQWQKRNGYPETGDVDEIQLATLEQEATRRYANRTQPKPSPPTRSGSGSGFFVSKLGHIITNEHVVRGCSNLSVGDSAKKQVTVTVIETDKRNDLALLKISSTKLASADTKSLIRKLGIQVVPLASEGLLRSEDVELGEDVMVSGYPYGEIFSDTIKVTKGIVSANRGMGDDTAQFQMDAAVQPGNSGGPIYDENGNIVGVVVAQLNKMKVAKAIGSMPENVNFGIKASTVRQFLTSSGLPTKWSNRSQSMSTKDLAKIAKNQTVMVVCNQ